MSTKIDECFENDELSPDNGNCDENQLSIEHEELIELSNKALKKILDADSYLKDIPIPIDENLNDEILAKIAFLKGESINVLIDRGEYLPQFEVVVPESTTTVGDLKKSIKRYFELQERSRESKRNNKKTTTKISWRYIWRTNFLVFDDEKLINDRQLLTYYGIGNRSVLKFLKKTKRVLNSRIQN